MITVVTVGADYEWCSLVKSGQAAFSGAS